MYLFEAHCPACGRHLVLGVDPSCGRATETSATCECGSIPVFTLEHRPQVELGRFKGWERAPREGAASPPAGRDLKRQS